MRHVMKLETGETIDRRTIDSIRRRAQAESWAWRWVGWEPDPGWQQHAACRGTNTALWFDDDRSKRPQLLEFCQRCPVRLDCGAEAMLTEGRHSAEVHGVRAGFGPHDRWHAIRVYDRLRFTAKVSRHD